MHMPILRLKLFLIFILLAGFGCQSPQKPVAKKLILISFDGFRYDYLSKTDTPNFDRLAAEGVISGGLIPVFPSKTFPNYYAIATGLYPENSGFVGNTMREPRTGEYFRMSDRKAVENPDWYGGEPIWNTAEKQGRKSGTMFWVGSEAPIQNMRPTHWKTYDGAFPDSARIDTIVHWLSRGDEQEIDFATLYYSFVDTQGHRFGPDSPEVIEAIKKADGLMGYLIEKLQQQKLDKETNIIIVADHGMAAVSRERIIVLDDMINPDELEIIEGSPSLMANVRSGNPDEVYNVLKTTEKHFKVYKKEDLPQRFHLKNHRRVPDIIMIADVGYTINTRAAFNARPGYPSGGAHGYDNQEKEMWGIFIANGPDFKKGYQKKAFESVHIYNLAAHLLGITPAGNDGNPETVFDMLK